MKTLHWKVDPGRLETPDAQAALDRAAAILRAGGLVALPTETVYGLGANALDREAVERIFAAKGRPAWDPVIVHVAGTEMLDGLVEAVPDRAQRLMEAFWPGPLTLLLPRSLAVPGAVTAGRPLVGVRMPAHPVALALIRRAGVPVAAPSANLFGHISPTTAAHVLDDLDGRIEAVLDAGPTGYGVESTVLDPGQSPMIIYRPGAVTAEQIRALAGPVDLYREGSESLEPPKTIETLKRLENPEMSKAPESPQSALPSPGMGLRHYAPKARLLLVDAPAAELGARLAELARHCSGERVGAMLPSGIDAGAGIAGCRGFAWGRWDQPEELARNLYAGLRALDAEGCTVILCPVPPLEGIGAAIRDRLRKAARPE